MLLWILNSLLGVAVLGFAIYWFAPGAAFKTFVGISRRAAGLRLKQLRVGGHEIPYLEGGSGPTLLLLHGFGGNKDHWTVIAQFLTKHFHVVAPDVPGFGDSTRDPQSTYGLAEQLNRLNDFCTAAGLDKFVIGGNSMGGYLAATYAKEHREKVDALWLLAPAGVITAEPSEVLKMVEAGENPLLVETMEEFDRLTRLCFSKAPYMPQRFKLPLLKRMKDEAAFSQKIFDELFTELEQDKGLEQVINGLDVPTLVMWGEEDRVLDASGLERLRAILPQGRFQLIPAMGHCPMIERPSECAADWFRYRGIVG